MPAMLQDITKDELSHAKAYESIRLNLIRKYLIVKSRFS